MEVTANNLSEFFHNTFNHLNERQRRLIAGALSRALGRGGKTAVAAASGMSRNTVIRAEREVAAGQYPSVGLRRPGAGAKSAQELQPGLGSALDELVKGRAGDPCSPLRWTVSSSVALAKELDAMGFVVSDDTVSRLLMHLGYSRRIAGKRRRSTRVDPDPQFAHVNTMAASAIAEDRPVVSVDARIRRMDAAPTGTSDGQLRSGTAWARQRGADDALLGEDGWEPLVDEGRTARTIVEATRRWWTSFGVVRFPAATHVLIAADTVGPSADQQSWRIELGRLVNETGLDFTVCHMPPGVWRWDSVEHRMSSVDVTERKGALVDAHRTVVQLVSSPAGATANTRLEAAKDWASPLERYLASAGSAQLSVERHSVNGDWNYTVRTDTGRG